MPLADELGNAVVENVWDHLSQSGDRPTFDGGTFETWLSLLAERQPFLTETENAYNQADLLRISEEILFQLVRCQGHAEEGRPAWLTDFRAYFKGTTRQS